MIQIFMLFFFHFSFARDEIHFPNEIFVQDKETIKLDDIIKEPLDLEYSLIEWDIRGRNEISAKQILNGFKKINLRPLIKVPEKILINRNKITSVEYIKKRIQKNLVQICANCEFDVQIEKLPELSPNAIIDYSQIKGPGAFILKAKDQLKISTQWITGRIRRFELVPVSIKLIGMGQGFNQEDIEWKKMETTYITSDFATAPLILKSVATRSIYPGEVLYSKQFKKPIVLKKGQSVSAIIKNENFQVKAVLEAKEDATEGDMIKLKVPGSERVLMGKVIKSDEVELL